MKYIHKRQIFRIYVNRYKVRPIAAALLNAPGIEEPGLETVGVLVDVGQHTVVLFKRVVLQN